jgi:SH2 domain-containing protein 4A
MVSWYYLFNILSNFDSFCFLSGIISRPYTEQLLASKPVGSYLIRISEKIFGYVLSYHASDHCRHLLIEVTQHEHGYRFLGGAKKELFENLSQLITKYTV